MRAIKRFAITSGAVAAVSLGAAASAGAVVQVGSNFAAVPNIGPAPGASSTQNAAPTAATLPLTSPISGVIVSILVEHGTSGADPGVYGFRVLSGSPTTFSTTGIPAELPDFSWPANQTPGITNFTPSLNGAPKGIPIASGDRLGVVRSSGTTGQGAQIWSNNSPGGAMGATLSIHNSGSASYSSMPDFELMAQYGVEPDADGDGYGDESQDQCPTNAAAHGACPAPTQSTGTTTTKKKKCKKRKKRGAGAEIAKKKKCKKRK